MRIAGVSVLYVTVIAFFWWSNLSQIGAQGVENDPRPIGPSIGLYDPRPLSGADDVPPAFTLEEWGTPKEEIPYIYPWENRLNQTAQQMVAVLSLLEGEGLTSLDIELFLLELDNMANDPGKVIERNLERREQELRRK